eukprot:11955980-Heterocapsa_arctica.AAC.1
MALNGHGLDELLHGLLLPADGTTRPPERKLDVLGRQQLRDERTQDLDHADGMQSVLGDTKSRLLALLL